MTSVTSGLQSERWIVVTGKFFTRLRRICDSVTHLHVFHSSTLPGHKDEAEAKMVYGLLGPVNVETASIIVGR